MIIITEQRLIEYTKQHPDAASSLSRWGALVRAAKWRNLAEMRRTLSHAEPVGQCTISASSRICSSSGLSFGVRDPSNDFVRVPVSTIGLRCIKSAVILHGLAGGLPTCDG